MMLEKGELTEKQKMFVRSIVCDGLRQGEAYKKCFGNVKFPDSRASYLLKKTSILNSSVLKWISVPLSEGFGRGIWLLEHYGRCWIKQPMR